MANAYQPADDAAPDRFRESEAPGLNPPPALPIDLLRAEARRIKAEKGLSIDDVMMRSGLSRTATLDLLNGRGRIACGRLDTWWALAWALGVTISDLMRVLDEATEHTIATT